MSYLSRFSVINQFKKADSPLPIKNSDKELPKISVITASYNQGQFLERTILSVINQGYPNLEFIIIDGGSTDNSLEIIKKYENHLYYWVSEKDNGQADAINKGFKIATGDLLCFQNSDDIFYKNSFKLVSEFYKKHPEFDVYFGDILMIDAYDKVLEILKTDNFDIKAQILEGMQVFNQSSYFKKNLGEKLGYIDGNLKFVIDYESVLRWAYNGASFAKVTDLMGAFRKHEDAKTSNLEPIRVAEHDAVRDKYFKLIFKNKKPNWFNYFKLRLKKTWYFILNFDFSYLIYRNSI